MRTISIIAGEYRGRSIPFSNKKYGNADITQQKVKGALFSKLRESLNGSSFLDLYGGSGQIGFEALSRGADPVIINEKDRARFHFIRSFASELPASSGLRLFNRDALSLLEELSGSLVVDYIFIDPPYSKGRGMTDLYTDLLHRIDSTHVVQKTGLVIIQHYSGNILGDAGRLILRETRRYGSSSLSFFTPAD